MHVCSRISTVPAGPPARRLRWLFAAALVLSTLHLVPQTIDPQRLFQEAVAAQQHGDDALAVRKYRELLRLHPEAVAVRVNLGNVLADLKQFNEAIEQYRLVLATDPTNRMARSNLAVAYQGKGDLPDAVKELERLHREDASDAQSTMLLADCYTQTGRYTDAIALLAPLEKMQPGDPDLEWLLGSALIHSGHNREGVERAERAAEKSANADAYLLAGQARFSMNQYDLARRDADAARNVNPKLAGLETLYGMILEQTSDYDGAQAALEKAVAADATNFNAQLYLGADFYFKREMENARLHLTRALQLQPDSAQARYELALVERADGHLDAALRDLERVVRATPDWMQPHVELSALYFRLHRPEDGAKERAIVDRMMVAQQASQAQAAH